MSDALTIEAAAQLLYAEARCLDERRWDDWLEMFTEDALYWVPAWKSELEPTSSPDEEISLIYYQGRSSLVDRIWRLRSGLSVASTPLRRTTHMITNIAFADTPDDSEPEVRASWAVHQLDPKRRVQHVFFGHYEHRLRRVGEGWKIAGKKILLLNDQIPAVADIYLL